jgi:hypothetical protein
MADPVAFSLTAGKKRFSARENALFSVKNAL